MKSILTLTGTMALMALTVSSVYATPVVLNVTEDFLTIANDWGIKSGFIGGGTLQPSGGGAGGYLGVQFSSNAIPQDAILYVSSNTQSPTNGYQFTGNMGGVFGDLAISFKFNAFNNPVNSLGGLQLYFKGANLNSTWIYDLTALSPQTPGWVTISTPLNVYGGSGWNVVSPGSGTGSLTDWQNDWSNVSEFGFLITKNNTFYSGPVFGLDDIVLTVPEPETVWLVLAALASLGLTFRSRIGDTLKGLVSRA